MDLRNRTHTWTPSFDAPFSVASEPSTDAILLHVRGELDLATAAVLRAALDSIDDDIPIVYVDLAQVSFIDCAGWDAIASPRGPQRMSRRIVIVHPSKQVRRLMDLLESPDAVSQSSEPARPKAS